MNNHILGTAQLFGRFQPDPQQAILRELENDKAYVEETDKIKQDLAAAYAISPATVVEFFEGFSLTSAFAQGKVAKFMRSVDSQPVRRALEDYVKYADRFRVYLRLKTEPLHFEPRASSPYGEKFHVKIVGDHLEPAAAVAGIDDPFVEYFKADKLTILSEAQKLIDDGKATFVQIDDGPGYSLMKDLESFAYRADGVAFFLHNAEQPYLGCIFGEKMTKQLLHDIGKTLTEFQKKYYRRGTGGRPADVAALKKMQEVANRPISDKAKAIELAEGGDEKQINVQKVKLSQFKKKRRSRKR
jgi:hypothetical protein